MYDPLEHGDFLLNAGRLSVDLAAHPLLPLSAERSRGGQPGLPDGGSAGACPRFHAAPPLEAPSGRDSPPRARAGLPECDDGPKGLPARAHGEHAPLPSRSQSRRENGRAVARAIAAQTIPHNRLRRTALERAVPRARRCPRPLDVCGDDACVETRGLVVNINLRC
eukprot:1181276-Prorocentrum_minimum.AAC.2